MLGGRGPSGACSGPGCQTTGWFGWIGSTIRPIQPGTRMRICWRSSHSAAPAASTSTSAIPSLRIAPVLRLCQCGELARRKAMIALYPTKEQIEALLSGPADRPVVMLNLLQFKRTATAPDEGMSGEQAYQ